MYKARCCFYKKGDLIFISHLDLVRLMERAIRRAGVPISYSQGFNPHPILSFATALGVGVASEAEYMDLQLEEQLPPDVLIQRLNQVLPEGIKLQYCHYIDRSEEALMAILGQSSYLIQVQLKDPVDQSVMEAEIQRLLEQDEIIQIKEKKNKNKNKYSKATKKVSQEVNIRHWIHEFQLMQIVNQTALFKVLLTTGSKGNLKPEILMQEFAAFSGLPIQLETVRVNRLQLFKEVQGAYVPLLAP